MAKDGKTHVVEKGETLETLSRRYYGASDGWSRIQKANNLPAPVIWPGDRLVIPGIEPEREPEPILPPTVVKHPVLTLSSRQSFTIEKITLYDADLVREIVALRAKAMKNFEGFSTGIGFLGSPEWAIGGAAVLGLFEGVISNSMKSQGIEILREIQHKTERLTRSGKLIDIAVIENLEFPDPQTWSSTTRADGITKRLVHNGNEFVSLAVVEGGPVQVRWSSVVAYSPPLLESR
ncbi:LysM peptidoglycan-binding domain-containing protein [Microvirga sp. BT688]|uniref:LysM peptidoglycan-binding domain-containing protein n=1 Tax=Microvirga sp. TaxID=1873136 RepID=UPI001686BD6B|nr:LysM peptidoglycan-binding domain-containing protein [Microvirga sp.]MBD2751111.1 LysM peptidoglycan-binding domain-containing protein [Microvirga sp.]